MSVSQTLGQDGCGVAVQRDVGQADHGMFDATEVDVITTMWSVLNLKFQDPTLRRALITTLPRMLVESPHLSGYKVNLVLDLGWLRRNGYIGQL